MGRPRKVTREDRYEIYRRFHDESESISELARDYGVSRAAIHGILAEFEEGEEDGNTEEG